MNSAVTRLALPYPGRMKPEDFTALHREYLQRADAVKVFADADGQWSVYIQVGGPYQSADRAGEVAKLISADLADVYRNKV